MSPKNNGYHPQNNNSYLPFEIQNEESITPEEIIKVWERRAYALAQETQSEETGQTMDILVFQMGGERYGIEVVNIREIYPLAQLTPVPRTPDFVAGVFSARGRILSVIDLRAFFGMSPISLSDQTKIIVVSSLDLTTELTQPSSNIMEVGILADEVADVITIFKENIEPPLSTHSGIQAKFIQGITSDLLVVLNHDTLLNDEKLIIQEEII